MTNIFNYFNTMEQNAMYVHLNDHKVSILNFGSEREGTKSESGAKSSNKLT